MSFFNGDTSVSEQILSTSSFGSAVSITSSHTDGSPYDINKKSLVFLEPDTGITPYVRLTTSGVPNGFVTKIFIKNVTNTTVMIKSSNLASGSDIFSSSGKFYTFVYNPGGHDAKWYYQG